MKYVTFLRGINVGGKTMVKMEELRKVFESLGFENVKTLLNSGNVIFETDEKVSTLVKTIEEKLEKTFGFAIRVFVRSEREIQKLVGLNPFKKIRVTPQTRLYVTFILYKPKHAPAELDAEDFKIVHVTDGEVCSVITVSTNRSTSDMMKFIEKTYGGTVTTRNWNTIQKIARI